MNLPFTTVNVWVPVVDAALKVTLVLLAAAVIAACLRRRSAATRHLVWACGLTAALLLPVLSLTLPRWTASVGVVLPSLPQRLPAAPDAHASGLSTAAAPAQVHDQIRSDSGPTAPSAAPGSTVSSRTASIPWASAAVLVWALGVALLLARLLLGLVAVQLLARRSTMATGAPWLPLARRIAAEVGVGRVSFRRGPAGTMPMAWGVMRPVVLLPADADAWPESRLRVVLLHELAHVKRADCLTHLLAQAACALHWINPLTWMAARRARTERERACDDLVIAHGTRGTDYADALVEIARTLGGTAPASFTPAASLAMARRSHLEGRLMAILDPAVPRTTVSRPLASGAAAGVLCATIALATLQTWAYAEPAAVIPATSEVAVMTSERETPQTAPTPAPRPSPTPAPSAAPAPSPAPAPESRPAIAAQTDAAREKRERVNDPKLVAALTGALADTDRQVREAALQALVEMRDPNVFAPLMQALKDPAPQVRERAAWGLGSLGDPRAVPALIAALEDENGQVREHAVVALGRLDAREAVAPLIAALKDPNEQVREHAAIALGQIGDPRAVDPLIAALTDANAQVRQHAALALSRLSR